MTNYTKSNIFDGKNYKYPITSQETGNTYEVMIHPYGLDDERYLDGCIVSLRRKRFLFSKELYNMSFDNENGKMKMNYINFKSKVTDIDYNLVNMASFIVKRYEINNVKGNKSVKQLREDFTTFGKWDGIV